MTHQLVKCPNGHKLKASPQLFGQSHPCPKCGASVFIPADLPSREPLSPEAVPKRPVSDSSLMRILGSVDALPSPPPFEVPETRPCPRCDIAISVTTNVCEHCQCYVGMMPNFLRRLTGKANTRKT